MQLIIKLGQKESIIKNRGLFTKKINLKGRPYLDLKGNSIYFLGFAVSP